MQGEISQCKVSILLKILTGGLYVNVTVFCTFSLWHMTAVKTISIWQYCILNMLFLFSY